VSASLTVVSNSTPLIALSRIGRLDLLKQYFSEIVIPQAVYQEVVVSGGDRCGAKEVKKLERIKVKEIKNNLAVETFGTIVDRGEAEAIVLAAEMKASLLMIDDADGRGVALGMGLKVTGTVGILLMAAKDGKVELKRSLDQLLAAGFRLSEKEYQRIIELSGSNHES